MHTALNNSALISGTSKDLPPQLVETTASLTSEDILHNFLSMWQRDLQRHCRSATTTGQTRLARQARRKCRLAVQNIQSNRQPAQPPEDEQFRPKWQNPNDSPKLNPPALRPSKPQPPTVAADAAGTLDWRSYRAKLVMMERQGLLQPGRGSPVPYAFSISQWAHELPAPEVGCLLVARQQGMDLFDKSVVLLAAHDAAHGSLGFMLNKASPLKLSEVQLSHTAKGILEVFGKQQLQLGGPVHMETLTLLHAYSGLTGGQKISEGVYYGGLRPAVNLVKSGLAKPEDFTLMLGVSAWAPGQLEQEIAAGAWYVVAAGQALALPHKHIQGARRGKTSGRGVDGLWKQMLQLIGKPVRAV